MKDKKKKTGDGTSSANMGSTPSEHRSGKDFSGAVPGINTPDIDLPAFNPPVPNRAWTAMRQGLDIESLSPEEKRDLYLGRDNIL